MIQHSIYTGALKATGMNHTLSTFSVSHCEVERMLSVFEILMARNRHFNGKYDLSK
jgi:hypothetical protein